MDTVTIGGKKYNLVPVEEESLIDAYEPSVKKEEAPIGDSGVKVAVPKIYDYRERYKKKKIHPSEVSAPQPILTQLPRQDNMLDGYKFQGESLFFGPGVTQEV